MILYRTDDGQSQVQLRAAGGTVWLTQAEMAALFDTTPQNITQHVRNVYAEGEQGEQATSKRFLQVRQEGRRTVERSVQTYSLNVILAVGYRVRSPRAVQFRQWATTVLRDYLVKGFALDDERLEQPGYDYFDELLARIRDIRASEKRFYQKVRDLFAQTSADYDGASRIAWDFFATIQNKLVFAVTGRTAAERRQQTRMADWVDQTDRFLDFNERRVLGDAGAVSRDGMTKLAHERFDAFDADRRAIEAAEADREAAEELAAIEAEARRLAGGAP